MLSNLKSGKRLFPLFDFTTGFGAFPARLRTNDQMTVGCLLRSLRLPMRILICVNGVLKHVNTPDSYLRERCANIGDSVRSLA